MIWGTGPGSRPRLLGMLLLITTFLVGALAGAAFQRVLGAGEPTPSVSPRPFSPPERHPRPDIFDRIGVSAEQRERIDEILERRHKELDGFWAEAGPRMRAIVDSTRAEIHALLTPEQREEMQRIRAERRERKHSRGNRGRDGPR